MYSGMLYPSRARDQAIAVIAPAAPRPAPPEPGVEWLHDGQCCFSVVTREGRPHPIYWAHFTSAITPETWARYKLAVELIRDIPVDDVLTLGPTSSATRVEHPLEFHGVAGDGVLCTYHDVQSLHAAIQQFSAVCFPEFLSSRLGPSL